MSLIHEALEKVEQEKKVSPLSPAILSGTQEKVRPKENRRVIYGIVTALVFCFILGMIYLLVGSSPTDSPRGKSAKASLPPLSLRIQGRFALTGTTRAGTDWTAIINNQLVRVGDEVSGAKVVRIEKEEVTLDERGQTVTVNL